MIEQVAPVLTMMSNSSPLSFYLSRVGKWEAFLRNRDLELLSSTGVGVFRILKERNLIRCLLQLVPDHQ